MTCRRGVRAACVATALAAGLISMPAHADPAASAAKKQVTKSTQHGPTAAPGTRPAGLINLYSYWTKEWLAVDPAAPPAGETVDRYLRCHFTNQHAAMRPQLIALAVAAATHFHADVVEVVSGFRHPKYNLVLRKKGHQVARDSQHTHGNAIDFYLPGVPTAALHAWAQTHQKTQKTGGVGLYPDSGFIHMDIGPVRSWSGE